MKNYWLYVLKLKQGKYYVGYTGQRDPQTRIQQHKNGFYSAKWVKKYGYEETVEIINLGLTTKENAQKAEQELTEKYIKQYGIKNVRGGATNYSRKYFTLGKYRLEGYRVEYALTALLFFILGTYIFFTR